MNKHSGLAGLSGVSSDLRDIEIAAADGNKNAQLAIDVYCYRIKKYIAGYAAAMGGVDALVFTAGVGENSAMVRAKTCEDMEWMGISLDESRNTECQATETVISTADSKVQVLVVPTNEELVIARETKRIVESMPKTAPEPAGQVE